MKFDDQFFSVFSECFPMLGTADHVMAEKLEGADLLVRKSGDRITGFAAVDGNAVLLVCVHPEHQGKGLGSSLLEEAEELIRSRGYDRAVLGRSERDIFWGAVIDTMSHRFFENRGYTAFNGTLSMVLDAEDIPSDGSFGRRTLPEGLSYKAVIGGDISDVLEAVARVEPKWLKFYEKAGSSVIIKAVLSGRTVGFLTADTDAGTIITGKDNRTGLLGYVGVVPEESNRGIGLGMVAYAAEYMQSQGCTEVYVNYTSLDEWYAKLGFAENLWYWMGEKKL